MARPKQPLPMRPVVAEDHPDLVGGIIWSSCEIQWINDYGDRRFNSGVAKGMEAGALLFNESAVVAGMAMLVRRMARAMAKQSQLVAISEQAVDYLKRMGLDGSPLREDKSDCSGPDWTERDGEYLK